MTSCSQDSTDAIKSCFLGGFSPSEAVFNGGVVFEGNEKKQMLETLSGVSAREPAACRGCSRARVVRLPGGNKKPQLDKFPPPPKENNPASKKIVTNHDVSRRFSCFL